MKKKKKKSLLKEVKKGAKTVKKEWNKAVKDLENFDPAKSIDMPDFENDMKDFKLDLDCDL